MQKLFHVYIITNNLNQKKYIGKTSGDYNIRWKKHIKIAEGNGSYALYTKYAIHLAIAKYGKNNFSFQVLDSFLTEDEAYLKEIECIQKYNSIMNGYNMTLGGKSGGSGENSNVAIFSGIDINNIFDDFLSGLKCTVIAKKYNCTKTTIYNIIDRIVYCSVHIDDSIINKARDIRLLNKKTLPNLLDHKSIIADYIDGLSYRQISKKYNSSTFSIQKVIKNNINQSIINSNKMQPIDKEFANQVINDYINSDMTAKQIGNKYNKSKYVIYDILRGRTAFIDNETKLKIKTISKSKSAKKVKGF